MKGTPLLTLIAKFTPTERFDEAERAAAIAAGKVPMRPLRS
jgi:hypothetical protein